ncbi:hypothetical protein Q4589_12675 [Cobetia marina]|jgi:hypothetical protein|uniref:hypothetical protein n=1 Tax=Cobetia marina TaxID=28258 RepID=UPI00174E680D|nr:hypothetical protein [Cobetia marina]MDO6788448.1 hypothetical protein [Cobetia marina]
MATSTMTTLLDTCRAMTHKLAAQTFTPLAVGAEKAADTPACASQLLGVMAMGYEAPPLLMSSQVSDTRAVGDIDASRVAQQQAVFDPNINHKVHADWEAEHRHQTLLRHSMVRRGMLA